MNTFTANYASKYFYEILQINNNNKKREGHSSKMKRSNFKILLVLAIL